MKEMGGRIYYSQAEVAERLGMTPAHIRKRARLRGVEPIHCGGVYYTQADIDTIQVGAIIRPELPHVPGLRGRPRLDGRPPIQRRLGETEPRDEGAK